MAGLYLLLTHDTTFGAFEELDDVLDLRAIGHLILDLIDHIEHTCLSVEQQSIGIGDMLLYLLVDIGILHDGNIGTSISHGVTTSNDIWRHVLRESTTSLDKRQITSTGVGILDGTTGEDDSSANLTIASHLGTITEYAIVAYYGIVTDVGTLKQEVVVTYLGNTILLCATVDDHILADDIVVADLHVRLGTSEVEVLRQGGNHTSLMDLVAFADT